MRVCAKRRGASVLCWCRSDASVLVRDRERDGASGRKGWGLKRAREMGWVWRLEGLKRTRETERVYRKEERKWSSSRLKSKDINRERKFQRKFQRHKKKITDGFSKNSRGWSQHWPFLKKKSVLVSLLTVFQSVLVSTLTVFQKTVSVGVQHWLFF